MSHITEAILSEARSGEEGKLVSPKEFIHLGSRAAIDQAFSRLVKAEQLLRVSRGLYAVPVKGLFGLRPPSAETVIKSIEELRGTEIVFTGAAAANFLGLSMQVPTREIFLTSGRPCKIAIGKRQIDVRHAPKWQVALGNSRVGLAVRTIAMKGEKGAPETIKQLKMILSQDEWTQLRAARAQFPGWMSKQIGLAK